MRLSTTTLAATLFALLSAPGISHAATSPEAIAKVLSDCPVEARVGTCSNAVIDFANGLPRSTERNDDLLALAQALAEGQSMTVDDLLAIPPPPLTDSTSQVPASVPSEPLTARELDVLRLLAQDLSNPQIAERLVVSRRTVEAHLRSIYEKLGVKSREAAIRVAVERGLLE